MIMLLLMAAFVISVFFAMGEIAYRRGFPKISGVFVALFAVLLMGCVFVR